MSPVGSLLAFEVKYNGIASCECAGCLMFRKIEMNLLIQEPDAQAKEWVLVDFWG